MVHAVIATCSAGRSAYGGLSGCSASVGTRYGTVEALLIAPDTPPAVDSEVALKLELATAG
jgi:hypothetical protein